MKSNVITAAASSSLVSYQSGCFAYDIVMTTRLTITRASDPFSKNGVETNEAVALRSHGLATACAPFSL
eukprot:CAMPEP_0119331052 /NCGR_PEP_ID=MMETSP1333-20130426/79663_1 /TAXON_ID=418940 /ORGANISM="Scyphosphaera apsteinii, Strain RCC1455" /LENGTH=68 /DNA_ID=CAMNT_0007340571 /DNA_START=86 /DNA_END=292 /DNA_ORIENTATION=+